MDLLSFNGLIGQIGSHLSTSLLVHKMKSKPGLRRTKFFLLNRQDRYPES